MKKFDYPNTARRFLLIPLYLFALSASLVTAEPENNLAHQKVIDAVEQYVYSQLQQQFADDSLHVRAMPIDERIQIPSCPAPLTISASEDALAQSNVTVRAQCDATDWYLYMIVKATRMQKVVVLTQAVGPNTVLTEQNVELVEMDKNLIRTTTFADVETVIGARIKRRTRPGRPIVPSELCFVCKGDSIVIMANAGGLQIKTTGIAQQDGNLGDTIRVRNSRTDKTVHGQVVDNKKVEVQI